MSAPMIEVTWEVKFVIESCDEVSHSRMYNFPFDLDLRDSRSFDGDRVVAITVFAESAVS